MLVALASAMVLSVLLPPGRADAAFFFDAAWGAQGDADNQFETPEGIMLAPSGNVYVADTGNDRIQRFDGDGDARRH